MSRRAAPRLAAALVIVIGVATVASAAETERELMERGAWKQARTMVEARLAAHPDDAEAMALMSRVKLAYQDRKGSLELIEKAIAKDPRVAQFHFYLAETVGDMAQHGSILKKPGLAKRFKKEAEAAIALDPKHLEARNHLMMFYVVAPGIAGGDKKKAVVMADELVALDPLKGNLAHANLALELKDTTAAEKYYRKALEIDPKSYDSNIAYAGFLGSREPTKWDEIERHAFAAREANPMRISGWAVLAQVYAHQERWNDLDQVLTEAESKLPNNLVPYYQAGRMLYLDGKDMPRAEKYFRKYLSQEPEPSAPNYARAHWRLGLVLEKLGHAPEGKAEVEKAVAMDPEFDEAKKDLKRMKRT